MDSIRFGAFIAALRKELGLTQKELADRLNVTDKAVSKWETGKGFPDVKLLEPLAQALDVSLVELIRCERQASEHITMQEAEAVVSQALSRSEQITARRYLKLLKWLLFGIAVILAYYPVISLIALALVWYYTNVPATDLGIIGGADGPTAILISTSATPLSPWLLAGLLGVGAIICFVLAVRVRKLEKKLK